MRLLLILLSFATLYANAQTIDTAPLDAYWKMVESLKHGDSLSPKIWNDFLKIEANHTYIDNQGFNDVYLENLRKKIQYVYMPKYDSLLKARIKINWARVLNS